ncbi:MAG: beta-lactamase family protein [Pirellulaceae bacterium]|nr:beta-lactamase family protein [Pirellulaceae bacterium]
MRRRQFLTTTTAAVASGVLMHSLRAADPTTALEQAAEILKTAVDSGQVAAASIVARIGDERISRAFGSANIDSAFLLGSISKPMAIAAVMRLFDQRAFALEDLASKYLPEFKGEGRELVTIKHLMTHVSGLPDQLPENAQLRRSHATLEEFAKAAMRTPLHFSPGTKYEYSSMAILLATEIARRISGKSILELVQANVVEPLGMDHSALGYGRLTAQQTIAVQTEKAAPEAGGGDPTAKAWDWSSPYWRQLGAPWGGMHASAPDVHRFLEAFINPPPGFLSPQTVQLMLQNHNTSLRVPRGLGFALGPLSISPTVTAETFGHSGSTGTLAWWDQPRGRSLVILTSLPGQAVKPHPRELASAKVAG